MLPWEREVLILSPLHKRGISGEFKELAQGHANSKWWDRQQIHICHGSSLLAPVLQCPWSVVIGEAVRPAKVIN